MKKNFETLRFLLKKKKTWKSFYTIKTIISPLITLSLSFYQTERYKNNSRITEIVQKSFLIFLLKQDSRKCKKNKGYNIYSKIWFISKKKEKSTYFLNVCWWVKMK